MKLNLEGKNVVIIGGSSGIGRAVAEGFAKEECKVAVCARNAEKLHSMQEEFIKNGHELFIKSADAASNQQLESFACSVNETYGRIDVWVNNAGTNIRKPFDTVSEEEWELQVNSLFKSVYYGSAIAASYMKKAGGGVIINTSSFTSLVPSGGLALYSAMKAAVNNFTRTTATELACHNIRAVAIIPGYIQTELTAANIDANFESLVANIPMKRLGVPEDLVPAYLFLASDAASYINGISLPVSGAKLSTQNPQWSWQPPY